MTHHARRRKMPAEWQPQDAVLIAWPHESTDWRPHLESVERVYLDLARQITRFERLMVVAPDEGVLRSKMSGSGVAMERVEIFEVETNDTWTRDFGPITVMEDGDAIMVDFGFNGWGLKFPADLDNQVTRRLSGLGAFGDTPLETAGLILEGGSIDWDDDGTLLTTAECLMSPNRNPHLSRREIEAQLGRLLGADRFLWLEKGHLIGDDTDSHVDTLARLCPNNTILYTACDDPKDDHFEPLRSMADELKSFTTRAGEPYRLIPLPWPAARHDPDGQRIPATYANFLILNGAVLVPAYGGERDEAARRVVQLVFPDRDVVSVDCLPLLLGHGSLHCVTMQIPRGAAA
jgi:agmatine deiminase